MTHAPRPPVPPAPAGQGADGCSSPRAEDAAAAGGLECQYFPSGSMMPAAVPRGPGMSSGDYAVRFGSVGGHPLMTVRIPCASYAVRVSFEGETITPDPATILAMKTLSVGDPKRSGQPFQPDASAKRAAASAEMQALADRWMWPTCTAPRPASRRLRPR